MPVLFKIYTDFECILKGVKREKYQDHVPCSFAYKVVSVDSKFSKKEGKNAGKNAVYKFIKAILKEYNYCREVIKNILIKILLCLQ